MWLGPVKWAGQVVCMQAWHHCPAMSVCVRMCRMHAITWHAYLHRLRQAHCTQVLERICDREMAAGGLSWIHTKCLYRLSKESRELLKGVTDEMSQTSETPSGVSAYPGPSGQSVGADPPAGPGFRQDVGIQS